MILPVTESERGVGLPPLFKKGEVYEVLGLKGELGDYFWKTMEMVEDVERRECFLIVFVGDPYLLVFGSEGRATKVNCEFLGQRGKE